MGHNQLALGRIRQAFVGRKRLPCILLVVAWGHNQVVAYMGQQQGHKMGRACNQVVGRRLQVGIRRIQALVVVVVVVAGPFHWRYLHLLQLVVALVMAVVVVVVRNDRQYHYR